MKPRKLNKVQEIAVKECMSLLSQTIRKMEVKTEATLYFEFERVINESFDMEINYSDLGKVYSDGKLLQSPFHSARKEYREIIKLIKNNKA